MHLIGLMEAANALNAAPETQVDEDQEGLPQLEEEDLPEISDLAGAASDDDLETDLYVCEKLLWLNLTLTC